MKDSFSYSQLHLKKKRSVGMVSTHPRTPLLIDDKLKKYDAALCAYAATAVAFTRQQELSPRNQSRRNVYIVRLCIY